MFRIFFHTLDGPDGPPRNRSSTTRPTLSLCRWASPAGGDEPEAGGAWKSEKSNKKQPRGALRCGGEAKNFPLAEHGGLRWAPAAARRRGGGVAPRPSIRAAAAARGFPFDAVRVPRG